MLMKMFYTWAILFSAGLLASFLQPILKELFPNFEGIELPSEGDCEFSASDPEDCFGDITNLCRKLQDWQNLLQFYL